jgi:broad specificity phosphatase PhoE
MRLYIVRHGESEANVLRVVSNRGQQHGLTETGRQQAHTLADSLSGIEFAKIFASPLLRATQTAQILADRAHTSFEIADALREFDCGILEGKADAVTWAQHQELLQAWLQQNRFDERIDGGESFTDIQRRFLPFMERLILEYGQTDANILLVGHGGTYRCMFPVLMSNIDFDFAYDHHLGNTGYVLAEWQSGRFICMQWDC